MKTSSTLAVERISNNSNKKNFFNFFFIKKGMKECPGHTPCSGTGLVVRCSPSLGNREGLSSGYMSVLFQIRLITHNDNGDVLVVFYSNNFFAQRCQLG